MDLTIPHLLAYFLSTRYEGHRNVHMGFALLKLRLWLELLAFEASEHGFAVARSALGLGRLGWRVGVFTAGVSLRTVLGARRSEGIFYTSITRLISHQYTRIPMFTYAGKGIRA